MIRFLVTIIGIFILSHLFLYISLVYFFSITSKRYKFILGFCLALLSVSFILSTLLARFYANPFVSFFYYFTALWIGISLYLILANFLLWVIYGIGRFFLKLFFKQAIRYLAVFAYIVVFMLIFYGMWQANRIQITQIEVPIQNFPSYWQGKKIVQISDLHLGQVRGISLLKQIRQKINAIQPDLVVITGDLFDRMLGDWNQYLNELSLIQSKNGIYFVSGNHELYLGKENAEIFLSKAHIHLLDDDIVHIQGLQFIGIGYPSHDKTLQTLFDFSKHPAFQFGLPTILLSHFPSDIQNLMPPSQFHVYFQPKIDFSRAIKGGVSLQLSGHTHQGQIIPFTWLTSFMYHHFEYGLHHIDDFYIYTTSGAGTWGPAIRIGSQSEIVVIHLVKKKSDVQSQKKRLERRKIMNDLEAIFAKQIELNQRINPSLYEEIQDSVIKRERFLQFELALRQESAEAVDSLNWKWWKKQPDDWDNIKIELVDMLHFWVSMCTVAGLSAQEVVDLYFKKNQLNHKRQEEGYKEGTYDKYKDGKEDNMALLEE